MGRTVLIASGKGGVGKSTFAVNMGVSMAMMGAKTLLVDLNIGMRCLDIYTGLEDRVLFDIGDVISGVCEPGKAIIKSYDPAGLSLLACPQARGINGITAAHLRILMEKLRDEYDVILVTCPPAIGKDLEIYSAGADSALVITTLDYASIRNAEEVDSALERIGIRQRWHAINMVSREACENSEMPDMKLALRTFQTPLAGIVAYDPDINIGNNLGRPASLEEDSYISENFRKISAVVLGIRRPGSDR